MPRAYHSAPGATALPPDPQTGGRPGACCTAAYLLQVDPITMSDPRTQAAPPDEAGHLGSQTVPEDVLEVPEADQPAQPPHLHRDVPPKRSGAGLGVVISMLIVVLVAVVIVWAYYYWGL